MKPLYLILAVVFLFACGVSNEQMTATAVMAQAQTETAAPTHTPTPTSTPTLTPEPTSTRTLQPTETPAPLAAIGETVTYDSLEITVQEVATHTQIVTGGYYYYYSKPGEIFIDMAVRIRNRQNVTFAVSLKEIYIVEESDDAWYPNFYAVQSIDLERPFNAIASLKLDEADTGNEAVSFRDDTYLRLVFYVKQNQTILFGIRESPQFMFAVE